MASLCAAFFFLALVLSRTSAIHLEKLGTFPVTKPAFLSLGYESESEASPSGNCTLLVSSFAPFSLFEHDALYYARGVENYLPNNVADIKVETLTTQVVWPNEFKFVPSKYSYKLHLSFVRLQQILNV